MGHWIDVGHDHLVQAIPNGEPGPVTLLWEHDTLAGYKVPRHLVSTRDGATWTASYLNGRLTLSPSVHCDRQFGGCGMHGFIVDGEYR